MSFKRKVALVGLEGCGLTYLLDEVIHHVDGNCFNMCKPISRRTPLMVQIDYRQTAIEPLLMDVPESLLNDAQFISLYQVFSYWYLCSVLVFFYISFVHFCHAGSLRLTAQKALWFSFTPTSRPPLLLRGKSFVCYIDTRTRNVFPFYWWSCVARLWKRVKRIPFSHRGWLQKNNRNPFAYVLIYCDSLACLLFFSSPHYVSTGPTHTDCSANQGTFAQSAFVPQNHRPVVTQERIAPAR
jgi:hypothetical protein